MQLQTEVKNDAVYEGYTKDLMAWAGRGQASAFISYPKPPALAHVMPATPPLLPAAVCFAAAIRDLASWDDPALLQRQPPYHVILVL